MRVLIEQAIEEYKQCLELDPENTDSLFFILEDIGSDNDLSEEDFQELCDSVDLEIN